VLAAGMYGAITLVGPKSRPAAASCPNKASAAHAAAAPVAPAARQITVNVYNATPRHGLAASTADQLKQRGFTIGKVTNDPLKADLPGAAQIRGSAAAILRVVAAEVAGAQITRDARADSSVDLVLGAAFAALATPAQVSAALAAVPPKSDVACAH